MGLIRIIINFIFLHHQRFLLVQSREHKGCVRSDPALSFSTSTKSTAHVTYNLLSTHPFLLRLSPIIFKTIGLYPS